MVFVIKQAKDIINMIKNLYFRMKTNKLFRILRHSNHQIQKIHRFMESNGLVRYQSSGLQPDH